MGSYRWTPGMLQNEIISTAPTPPVGKKYAPTICHKMRGSYGVKIPCPSKGTVTDFYSIRTPTFMPYETILLWIVVVFKTLTTSNKIAAEWTDNAEHAVSVMELQQFHSHRRGRGHRDPRFTLPDLFRNNLRVESLGTPNPRSSRRWNFEISVTGAVPRHGVINWEEFGEKFWWVVLHSQWSTKLPRNFRPKFHPIFRPILRPEFRPVIKMCSHNFALGNVRRKE